MHPAAIPPDELHKDCQLTFGRRSGPGGQHRNKVETAVIVRHLPTGIEGQASERRSQADNRKLAVTRLRVNLALMVRVAAALSGEPSPTWRAHCRHGRIAINPQHANFATLLAEALDVLAITRGDVKEAARQLECTPSQLVRLMALERRALAQVNQQRLACGERPLHAPR